MWIESARPARVLANAFAAALGLAALAPTSPGQNTDEALASLWAGEYEECLAAAELAEATDYEGPPHFRYRWLEK